MSSYDKIKNRKQSPLIRSKKSNNTQNEYDNSYIKSSQQSFISKVKFIVGSALFLLFCFWVVAILGTIFAINNANFCDKFYCTSDTECDSTTCIKSFCQQNICVQYAIPGCVDESGFTVPDDTINYEFESICVNEIQPCSNESSNTNIHFSQQSGTVSINSNDIIINGSATISQNILANNDFELPENWGFNYITDNYTKTNHSFNITFPEEGQILLNVTFKQLYKNVIMYIYSYETNCTYNNGSKTEILIESIPSQFLPSNIIKIQTIVKENNEIKPSIVNINNINNTITWLWYDSSDGLYDNEFSGICNIGNVFINYSL
jgi:hypothetical protein